MIKTASTTNLPAIEWEITSEILEEDVDERMTIYRAEGKDNWGNDYSGSAVYFHDDFDEMKNIEEV